MRHPELLLLVLLAAVPLILHLLDRRRARVVSWPAVRFLHARSSTRMRRLHAQEILLLVFRSLAVLALVLALVQFFGTETTTVRSMRTGPQLLVIYLDTSPSMSWRSETSETTTFDKARDLAISLLDDSQEDDLVVVLHPQGARSTNDNGPELFKGDAARKRLAALEIGGTSFFVEDALERCVEVLEAYESIAAEIYVFSDFQSSALPDSDSTRAESLALRLRPHSDRAAIYLIDCSDPQARNRFVETFSSDGLAPAPGRSTTFFSSLDYSPPFDDDEEESTPVEVALRFGARTLLETSVLPIEAADGFTLEANIPREGTALLTLGTSTDGLSLDDRRHLVLEVLPHISVLIISRATARDREASARYIELALYPSGPELSPPAVPFRPVRTRSLKESDGLEGVHVVIVCSDARLTRNEGQQLEAYIRRGGGVLLVAGAGADPAGWNDALSSKDGPSPAKLGTHVSPTPPAHLESFDDRHPSFVLFAHPENGDLTTIGVRGYSRVSQIAAGVRVVAEFSGGDPWILERSSGAGKVLLVTTAISPVDTDLVHRSFFLPWMHQLVAYLAARTPEQRSADLGAPLSWKLYTTDALVDAAAIDPRGEPQDASVILHDEGVEIRLETTKKPGFYRLIATDPTTDERRSTTFAVNVSASESRIERASLDRLNALAEILGAELSRALRSSTMRSRTVTIERQYRVWFALATLAFLFAEALLARRLAAERGAG